MYKFLTRNGQTLGFGLGLLLVVGMLVSIFSGVEKFSAFAEDDMERYQTTIFNFGMYAAFFLVVAAAVAAVLFGIMQFVGNPKGALKGLLGLLAVVALFFVIYSAADPDVDMIKLLAETTDFAVTEGQSKMITGSIWTALILSGVAIAATVISEVLNFFR